MTDSNLIPLFTLNTGSKDLPDLGIAEMNNEQLAALRTMLATMADEPVVTLEVHPLKEPADRTMGLPLGSLSPLAKHLSKLITQSAKSGDKAVGAAQQGETLYRMVVPAKTALQLGLEPMKSASVSGGIHSALIGKGGIAAQASFVPVTAGTAGGSAVAVAGASSLVAIAAPLVLMAAAVGASAYADHQRQEVMNRITHLLDKIHDAQLDDERNSLDACRSAIDKATAVLLDQGRVGVSLGLDSAVYQIDKALVAAEKRISRWQQYLDVPAEEAVDIGRLKKGFPGIDSDTGEFYAHLELARLAIAFKKRVVVLQAVEHAQQEGGNPLRSFMQTLKVDHQKIDRLEGQLDSILLKLSTLQLTRGGRIFSRGELDEMLRAGSRLRTLGEQVRPALRRDDVAIEIARNLDGSVVVLPTVAA